MHGLDALAGLAHGRRIEIATVRQLDILMTLTYHHDVSKRSQAPTGVRTTVTLEADVASRLHEQVRKTGRPFKDVVNGLLRRGLAATEQEPAQTPFVVRPFPMGLRAGLSYDSISDLLEAVDGPDHL